MADGFRRFRVSCKLRESDVITSFHLVPADGGELYPALPGQYLTLRVPGGMLRCYSLSCAVDAPHHRISVKRETGGAGSGWLHDHVAEGDEIELAAPRGGFVLDETSDRPVLLLGGGVGVTPLLSMLHRLAATRRRAVMVQAVEHGGVHAMAAEIAALAAASDGRIIARSVYRAPTEADRAAGRFDAAGVLDRAFLQALLPIDDYQVYLCGPTPFMVAMWRLLTGLGIRPERIGYEFFGKGASLAQLAAAAEAEGGPRPPPPHPARAPASLAGLDYLTDPAARGIETLDQDTTPAPSEPAPRPDAVLHQVPAPSAGSPSPVPSGSGTSGIEVVFACSGISVPWTGAHGSLLELAEAAGLAPEFSCREGICNSCRTTLRAGAVSYDPAPLTPPPAGQVLLCCARPSGSLVLEL